MPLCLSVSASKRDPRIRSIFMSYITETIEQSNRRLRVGKIAATLAIAWWLASVGGIIYVINQS